MATLHPSAPYYCNGWQREESVPGTADAGPSSTLAKHSLPPAAAHHFADALRHTSPIIIKIPGQPALPPEDSRFVAITKVKQRNYFPQ